MADEVVVPGGFVVGCLLPILNKGSEGKNKAINTRWSEMTKDERRKTRTRCTKKILLNEWRDD